MQYLADARQIASEYWRDIPKNTGKQMLYSFVFSSVARTLVSNDIRAGIFTGAVAALATAIHALVTPLFLKVISRGLRMTWEEEMCRTSIALLGAGYLASAFGDMTVLNNLFGLAMLYGLWNYIDANRRDLDRASWFVILPDHPRF